MQDQDAFDLAQFLPYQLAVLAERISRRLAEDYGRSHGLHVAEWRVLAHLARCDAVSVRDIHERVALEKPRVSRAVSRLEALGLVAKAPGLIDSRLVVISLTPKGRDALGDILPEVLAIEAKLNSALSTDERRSLACIMEKLHAVLDGDPLAKSRPYLADPT